MNEKGIGELRRRFRPDKTSVTHIRGCYVNEKGEIVSEFTQALSLMTEDEAEKMLALLRKALSGSLGKNLVDLSFTTAQVQDSPEHRLLTALRDGEEEAIHSFYEKVAASLHMESSYLILLAQDAYDVPFRGKDGQELEDGSDTVFRYVLCSICPVKLSKAGLCYNAEANLIQDRIRDWIVEMPENGFLFPVFNDRSTDIHGMLYYAKNAEQLHDVFVDEMFGCTAPLSAGGQRDSFNLLVEETLGEDCQYDTVVNIHEKLNEIIEAQKDSPDPVVLTKSEVKRLFEDCGVEEEKLETFDDQYDVAAGEKATMVASNITNTRKFEIKTPDVVIHVEPEKVELVETRIIDGRKCLVIPMEDVEINGIRVRMGGESSEHDDYDDYEQALE